MQHLELEMYCTLFLEGPIGPGGRWTAIPRFGGTLRGILQRLANMPRARLSDSMYIESIDGSVKITGTEVAAWAPSGNCRRDVLGDQEVVIWAPRCTKPHRPNRAH
jgi:hypothetical protein